MRHNRPLNQFEARYAYEVILRHIAFWSGGAAGFCLGGPLGASAGAVGAEETMRLGLISVDNLNNSMNPIPDAAREFRHSIAPVPATIKQARTTMYLITGFVAIGLASLLLSSCGGNAEHMCYLSNTINSTLSLWGGAAGLAGGVGLIAKGIMNQC